MHGDDGEKGTEIFQSIELVGLILTGGWASAATPEQFGPRNVGHAGVAPCNVQAAATEARQHKAVGFIGRRLCQGAGYRSAGQWQSLTRRFLAAVSDSVPRYLGRYGVFANVSASATAF